MKQTILLLLKIGVSAFGYLYFTSNATLAQVTSDGTVNTTVNQNGNIAEITGGETRGSNLFHSFQDFSVPTGNEAFFNNADSISNILSRVTGGNISNIDGLIRANGSASLFLINPAGIIFGENARLDIGGSFYGSTSSSILFEDGEFSAVDNLEEPVLTINAPIGLGFRDEPGDIINRAGFTELENGESIEEAGLEVNRGEAITLVGGNINLENGRLTAPGGRIELASLAGEGTISFNEDLSLNFSDELTRSDVTLTGVAEIDVTSGGGGEILIFANKINVLGGSDICAGIGADGACGGRATDFGSPNAQAGDIVFNAIDTVTVDGGISDVNNQVNFNSLGNGGNINIQTGSLSVTNGGRINTITAGEGNAGTIKITATEQVFLADSADNLFTSLRSNIASDGIGNSGGININTDSLSVQDGAQIQSLILGAGNSGKITINANSIEFSGRDIDDFPSGAFSIIQGDNTGNVGMRNAGGIDITANSLVMSDRAQFLSITGGVGNAGDINLQIAENTYLFNSSILSEVSASTEDSAGGFGEGGDINITTNSFLLQDGSALLADSENVGNAGNIQIDTNNFRMGGTGVSAAVGATDLVPSQITTSLEPQAIGDGGNITVSASSMVVSNDAIINVTTFGQGNARGIDITANSLVMSDRAQVSIGTGGVGNAGEINLTTTNLNLTNGSSIVTQTDNPIEASNVRIEASESIEIDGIDTAISSQTGSSGDAGSLSFLHFPNLLVVVPIYF